MQGWGPHHALLNSLAWPLKNHLVPERRDRLDLEKEQGKIWLGARMWLGIRGRYLWSQMTCDRGLYRSHSNGLSNVAPREGSRNTCTGLQPWVQLQKDVCSSSLNSSWLFHWGSCSRRGKKRGNILNTLDPISHPLPYSYLKPDQVVWVLNWTDAVRLL